MGRSDSRPPISPHFVAFVWRYHRVVPRSSPSASDVGRGSSWSWSAGSPAGISMEAVGSLRFPSDPRVPAPCSWTPVGPKHARPLRRVGAAPACANHGGSHNSEDFGARSHSMGTHCLRFAGRVTPPPRKTRFRLLARLCRAGFVHPQGCDERFPSSSLFLLSRACLTLWHGFVDGKWPWAWPYDRHRLSKPALHNIGAIIRRCRHRLK